MKPDKSHEQELAEPLSSLMTKYEQHLRDIGRSPAYIRKCTADCAEVFHRCKFDKWGDIDTTKIENFLRARREGRIPKQSAGIGYARCNSYVGAITGFCNWVVHKCKWASESPVRKGLRLNEAQDRRHIRRVLTAKEVRQLLETTATGNTRHGMSGRERYLVYRTAIETGMGPGELRGLKVGDFDLEKKIVAGRDAKSEPLSSTLCAELKGFLRDKAAKTRVFGGSRTFLTGHVSAMLREDLDDARIPFKDDKGRVVDFMALRVERDSLRIKQELPAQILEGV